jgi:glycosyltransferase involved in cell wall biosynthesis
VVARVSVVVGPPRSTSPSKPMVDPDGLIGEVLRRLPAHLAAAAREGQPGTSELLDVLAEHVAGRPAAQVPGVAAWIADAADVVPGPLVSVTMATRNRPDSAVAAVRSVLAQSYPAFEVVVADDSDGGETAVALAELADDRIRVVPLDEHRGAGAAFNAALGATRGELITFLDDDNLMHRDWLRSVVWAFGAFPHRSTLYGARIIENPEARHGVGRDRLPIVHLEPYDRTRMEQRNFVDRGTIALRAGLGDVRFDETLAGGIDWEHALRLFARSEPLVLPAVAGYYRTLHRGRISDTPRKETALAAIRARAHTTRTLRVHALEEMFPVQCESYIRDDLDSLLDAGIDVTVSAVSDAVSGSYDRRPISRDPDAAILEHRPDLILLHWSSHTIEMFPILERHGIPFVTRLHSFDPDLPRTERVLAHPLCAGVIAYPAQWSRLPSAVVALDASISPDLDFSPVAGTRSGLVSVSAGLVKKDFPLLCEAMALVPHLPRTIIVARTNNVERVPDDVAALVAEVDPTIDVRINLTRQEAIDCMRAASTLVYTIAPGVLLGQPMSVIEAMASGTVIIGPERTEIRDVVGSELRVYETAADIARHAELVEKGGPHIDLVRDILIDRSLRFRDAGARARLGPLLSDALTSWKSAHPLPG